MNGFLEIKNLKDNSIESLSYYTLQQLEPSVIKEKLKSLYNPYRFKKLRLLCMCNEEPIDMGLRYYERTDTYFLSSFPNQAENHHPDCYFYDKGSLSSDGTINEKSVNQDENGNLQITLNSHDFKKEKGYKANPQGNMGLGGETTTGVSSSKLSTHQLIKMIVAESWNTYVFYKGRNKYPNIKLIFEQIYNYTLKKFYIAKKINLKDVLFNYGKTGRIFFMEKDKGSQSQPFVIFLLESFDRIEEDKFNVCMTNPVTDELYIFTANKNIVDRANQINRVDSNHFILGGFVKSTGKGQMPEFISLAVLPVNKNGAFIESSYEKEFYDMLCEEKRLFQRPMDSKYHPKWNGLVPDGLLIDTSPNTILEVFGMSESNRVYHHHREYKIKHYSSLKKNYSLWYWDAFKYSSIPPLPPREY